MQSQYQPNQTQTQTQTQSLSSLSASVTSLRSSLSLLDSSIAILDAGISDFPRLKTVLSSTRHFELTPSTTLSAAQASLASELTPAITTLLLRAENYISKLSRKADNLSARSELLDGRLEGNPPTTRGLRKERSLEKLVYRSKARSMSGGGGKGGGRQEEKILRLRALKQKKERLGYAVERLELQSQQRQRQLRMSVAATKDKD